jgi:hypothetical protein
VWDLEWLEEPLYRAAAHREMVNAIDGFGGQVGLISQGHRLTHASMMAGVITPLHASS